MASQLVNIKFGERRLKLRLNKITEENLSKIFKLDISKGIYLTEEQEEEIVLAGTDGNFTIEDATKTYIVNGEPYSSPLPSSGPSTTTSIALPLSYQRPSTNPPPGGILRPTFTASRQKFNRPAQWKKSVTLIEADTNGVVSEKFQLHLTLQEDTANIEMIKQMIKDQIGEEVAVVDSKYLPIMAGTTTQGSKFWKSSRKVMVIRQNEFGLIQQKRKGKKSMRNDVLNQIRELVESQDADQAAGQQPATSTKSDTSQDAKAKIKEILLCSICLNTAELPAAVCANCYHTIGCIACIEQWYDSRQASQGKCPLCRTQKPYNIIPVIRGICDIVGQVIPPQQQNSEDTSELSDASDDAYLFTSAFAP